MKHVNLFAKIGRAVPVCIGTFAVDGKKSDDAHEQADAAQSAHMAEMQRSGVDVSRVDYSRVVVDVDALIAKDAAERAAAAKKGA